MKLSPNGRLPRKNELQHGILLCLTKTKIRFESTKLTSYVYFKLYPIEILIKLSFSGPRKKGVEKLSFYGFLLSRFEEMWKEISKILRRERR